MKKGMWKRGLAAMAVLMLTITGFVQTIQSPVYGADLDEAAEPPPAEQEVILSGSGRADTLVLASQSHAASVEEAQDAEAPGAGQTPAATKVNAQAAEAAGQADPAATSEQATGTAAAGSAKSAETAASTESTEADGSERASEDSAAQDAAAAGSDSLPMALLEELPLGAALEASMLAMAGSAPTSDATLPEEGYDLKYLIQKGYQLVSFGDLSNEQHTLGGVLIQGNLTERAGSAGMAHSPYVTSPSFIQGYVTPMPYNGGFNGSKAQHPVQDVLVGSSNQVSPDGKTINGITYGTEGYNHEGMVRIDDHFVDWDRLKTTMENLSDRLETGSEGNEYTSFEYWKTYSIQAGSNVRFRNTDQKRFQLDVQGSSAKTTVINILDCGTVVVPQLVTYNGQKLNSTDTYDDMPVLFNFPNASKVIIPTDMSPSFGHILAPNADVEVEGGNYNGTIVGRNVTVRGEGHLRNFHGDFPLPELTPATANLQAHKTYEGGTLAGGDFTFVLQALTEGAPMPQDAAGGFVEKTNKADGSIDFGSMTYTEPGTWLYQITEKASYNGSAPGTIQYDDTVYCASVTVTQCGSSLTAEVSYQKNTEKNHKAYCPPAGPATTIPTFTNTLTRPGLLLRKVNAADEPMTAEQYEQVAFRITYTSPQNGCEQTLADNEHPDAEGFLKIEDLAPGTYVIRETSAPEGYMQLDDPITIEVDSEGHITLTGGDTNFYRLLDTDTARQDGQLSSDIYDNLDQVLIVRNYPYIVMPQTGRNSRWLCLMLGALLILIGGRLLAGSFADKLQLQSNK